MLQLYARVHSVRHLQVGHFSKAVPALPCISTRNFDVVSEQLHTAFCLIQRKRMEWNLRTVHAVIQMTLRRYMHA